jgi:ABC-2 type transport system permease protein
MFKAALVKEFKLVFRDMHSVLVLFVMPAAFIIIMSLALQDQFSDDDGVAITVYYSVPEHSSEHGSENSQEYSLAVTNLVETLAAAEHFHFIPSPAPNSEQAMLTVLGDDSRAFLTISDQLESYRQPAAVSPSVLKLWLSPSMDARNRLLLESLLRGALMQTRLHFMQAAQQPAAAESAPLITDDAIAASYLGGKSAGYSRPSAVQQNVPAWLIFSMFFVVIPISTTLITERQQGTLTRLRTMNISMGLFLAAKAVPYLLINQLQLLIMLLLGVYLVPLLGGDSLSLGSQPLALMLLSLAVGVSAIGYALLVAVLAKTTAQAASLGGVGNILLAAIGGIMVPRFVMPDYLQEFAVISPMSWGLDGFLEVLLYGKGIAAIVDELLMLVAFGAVMLALALLVFNKKSLGK